MLVYWREFDGRMVAPPWLVYSELLVSDDPRAREAAEGVGVQVSPSAPTESLSASVRSDPLRDVRHDQRQCARSQPLHKSWMLRIEVAGLVDNRGIILLGVCRQLLNGFW